MSVDLKKLTGDIPRPEPVSLRAGLFSLELHGADIRHIRLGGVEVVQRVYMALRDQNWGTLESHVTALEVDDKGDSFTLGFKAENRKGDIAFDWEGRISGSAKGEIVFDFVGVAMSDFPRARLGLCALYPSSARGITCAVRHSDGSIETKPLPRNISPHQPFMDISSICMDFPGVGKTTTAFSGEIFEMEDQRNWTDASFKIYGTPIASPAPIVVHKGEVVRQSIRITYEVAAAAGQGNASPADELILAPGGDALAMPLVGVSFAPGDVGSEMFIETLRPGLIRLFLDYTTCSKDAVRRQFEAALKLSAPLLVEAFLPETCQDDALEHMRFLLGNAPTAKIRGVSPLGKNHDVTLPEWLDALRSLSLPLGWGTDGFPVHVNRNRPGATRIDFCVFPALPQVHSFDNVSITDNLPGMTAVVENAHDFQSAPVIVAPLTFNWRSNPVAVAPEPARADDSLLPIGVDLRQQSLFGAAWLAACVQALATGGADSVIFFESVMGWKGLRESADPDVVSDDFPVRPGEIYPVAAALHWLAPYGGGLLTSLSGAGGERGVGGFLLENTSKYGVFLYNLSNLDRRVFLKKIEGVWREYRLDAAVGNIPEDFRFDAALRDFSLSGEMTLPACSLTFLESIA